MQTKKGKRREQQGRQIYRSFGKWQCNATQGHCTATTYFAPLYDLVMCCCPFHPPTPNQSPLAPCQNPPPSTSSFSVTQPLIVLLCSALFRLNLINAQGLMILVVLPAHHQSRRTDFASTHLLLPVLFDFWFLFGPQIFIHRRFHSDRCRCSDHRIVISNLLGTAAGRKGER